MDKKDLRDLSDAELEAFVEAQGCPQYRKDQLVGWLCGSRGRPGVAAFSEMANLPGALRRLMAETFQLSAPGVERVEADPDQTQKFLLRLADGETIEAVLLPESIKDGFSAPRPWRSTLCVSTQVGCAMGCRFCRTATMGLKRNLSQSEILNQILAVQRYIDTQEIDAKVRNVVFMGMGEPLQNYSNLKGAIDWLCHPQGFGFSRKRITVSTSGLLPEMKSLLQETEVRLAVSLNATEEGTRRDLMPITRKYSLKDLIDYCRQLPLARRDRIMFEYVLLAGINDSDADAARLVSLMHGIRAKVNLLAFNEYPGTDFRRPSNEQVQRFREIVNRKGLQANIRVSRGRKVLGACGQLRSVFEANKGVQDGGVGSMEGTSS